MVAHAIVDAEDFERLTERRWHLHHSGYVQRIRNVGGKYRREALARVVLGLGPDDPRDADHINRDKLDNRKVNLRAVTRAENNQNRGGHHGSTRGVTFHKRDRVWEAKARLDGRLHHIGRFKSEAEAAEAVTAWRAEHMPFAVA